MLPCDAVVFLIGSVLTWYLQKIKRFLINIGYYKIIPQSDSAAAMLFILFSAFFPLVTPAIRARDGPADHNCTRFDPDGVRVSPMVELKVLAVW